MGVPDSGMLYRWVMYEATSWNSGAAEVPPSSPGVGQLIMMPTTKRGLSAGRIPAKVTQYLELL